MQDNEHSWAIFKAKKPGLPDVAISLKRHDIYFSGPWPSFRRRLGETLPITTDVIEWGLLEGNPSPEEYGEYLDTYLDTHGEYEYDYDFPEVEGSLILQDGSELSFSELQNFIANIEDNHPDTTELQTVNDQSILSTIMMVLANSPNYVATGVANSISFVPNLLVDITQRLADIGIDVSNNVMDALGRFLGSAGDAGAAVIDSLGGAAGNVIESTGQGISSAASGLGQGISSSASGIGQGAGNFLGGSSGLVLLGLFGLYVFSKK